MVLFLFFVASTMVSVAAQQVIPTGVEGAPVITPASNAPASASYKDQAPEQSEFGDEFAVGGQGKYFMYANIPDEHHYEFGYKRGNHHHHTERYEKANPHQGHFKTKVRWGDKHGGYGEHYWDYNHAGHGGSGESGNLDGDGDETNSQPQTEKPNQAVTSGHDYYYSNHNYAKNHRINNAREAPIDERIKRQQKVIVPKLVFDTASGTVIDELTGQSYYLQPVPSRS